MRRREFLRTGAAALAGVGLGRYAEAQADARLRVGLIGSGWYGKCDLFRLIQVAPVEVVSLCDVDTAMLQDAAAQTDTRQSRQRGDQFQAGVADGGFVQIQIVQVSHLGDMSHSGVSNCCVAQVQAAQLRKTLQERQASIRDLRPGQVEKL